MFDALATVVTIGIAGVASLFMAWTIGAGSSGSTPFAPAVGANAISVMRAAFVVGVLGFAGAVSQGANVTATVGSGLIRGVAFTPVAATVGLLTAAVLVAFGVFTGYPIATAFTVTGAMVGVGLAMGGAPAWSQYVQIAALWVLVPFVGGFTAYGTAALLASARASDAVVLPAVGGLVGGLVANVNFSFLGAGDASASVADAVARAVPAVLPAPGVRVGATLAVALAVAWGTRRDYRGDAERCKAHVLLGLGGLVAFSAGGTQVGLALGPLLPLIGDRVPLTYVLAGGGFGLLLGSWTGAPRMIKALSQDYSALNRERSIAALVPSFAIAQTAVFFGIPVSFNEIIVSSIFGAGYVGSAGGTSGTKMGRTVGAWVASLVLALATGYALVTLVTAVWPAAGHA